MATSIIKCLTKNATSGGVNIKNYASTSNYYTFPYDGYVVIDAGSGATAGQILGFAARTSNNVNVASVYKRISGSYDTESIFVKKGMFGFNTTASGTAPPNYSITYYPLDL